MSVYKKNIYYTEKLQKLNKNKGVKFKYSTLSDKVQFNSK